VKIPSKIKILNKTYNIIHDDEVTGKHLCYGITYHDNQDTYLRKRGPLFTEENQAEVLMHELVHNIDAILNINLTEEQTNLLSVGLITVIRDNNLDFTNLKE
jgi:hypothetical protein